MNDVTSITRESGGSEAATGLQQTAQNTPSTRRVGTMMREARRQSGLSLQDVAQRVGCAKSYLSAIETHRRSVPSDAWLVRIEEALGLVSGQLIRAARWEKSLEVGGVAVQRDVAGMRTQLHQQRAAAQRLAALLGEPQGGGAGLGRSLDEAYRSGELARLVARMSPPEIGTGNEHVGRMVPGNHEGLAGLAASGGQAVSGMMVPVALACEVPLINSVVAGYPTEFTDLGYPARVADEYVRCPDVHDPDAFAARVVGDSMEPTYGEGDVVVFSPARALASGQDCFARIEPDHTTTFKRVFFERDADDQDVIRLQPLNNRYPPCVLARERVAGLYAAVSVIRRV